MKNSLYSLGMTAFFMLVLMIAGCSDRNPNAPVAGNVHPADWQNGHMAAANDDLQSCQSCHGVDFQGSGKAVSCYTCHASGPPFGLHPAWWSDTYLDHRTFAELISWTGCAAATCHGETLHGGQSPQLAETGPSCFAASRDVNVCHVTGPPSPHSAYGNPALHGVAAKGVTDPLHALIFCRNCHSHPDNLFEGGMVAAATILNLPGGNCTSCHTAANAHPTNWQGTNDAPDAFSYSSSHRTVNAALIPTACALCHNTANAGPGPRLNTPSCFASNFTNANGSTSTCHPSGSGQAPHQVPFTDPDLHGPVAKADLVSCQSCHAEPGGAGSNPRFNVAIGNLAAGCEDCHALNAAHPPTSILPSTDRWTFRGDLTSPRRTHFSAGNVVTACALCHGATLDGVGGSGPSCFTCHVSAPQFSLRCDYCHGTSNLTGAVTPVNHAVVSNPAGFATAHDTCALCHGAKDDGSGKLAIAGSDYQLLDKLSSTLNQGGDHLDGRIEMNGPAPGTGSGYNANNFGCDSACHGNAVPFRLTDSGLSVAYGNYGNQPAAGCTTCHGYPPDGTADLTGATPVNHTGVGNLAAFLTAHNDCVVCHGVKDDGSGHHSAVGDYSIANDHRDNSIQLNSATGYNSVNFGCDVSCHGNAAPYRMSDSALPVALADFGSGAGTCDSCHTSGIGGAPVVISLTSPHTSTFTCEDCHSGHGTGTVIIPNNAAVGINYTAAGHGNGISLGGGAATGTTEAEICWNCHDLYAISEWGANQKTVTGNYAYNYGQIYTSNALTTPTSNWIGAWWKSGTPAFAYKTGRIQSTHAANSAVSAAGVDLVSQIRCSYCHDVHDLNRAPGDTASGKPYLRGSWKGNPYKEDGAPQSGTAYLNLQRFGAVPRGNTAQTTMGGYWIDQNSANPTATFSLANSAGLCTLCHGNNVNTLNQFGSAANAWIGSNGHANATIGGTGLGAANIFDLRGGVRADSANPAMAFQGASDPGDSGSGSFGFRNNEENAAGWTPRVNPVGESRNYANYQWGATVDATTINLQYHKFSCSKCHNPHAARLPRLLITNCLDTKHNTWDNSFQLAAAPQGGSNNIGRSISNWTSAQNCHRLGGNDPNDTRDTAGTGAGWNRVSPWTNEGTQDNGTIP